MSSHVPALSGGGNVLAIVPQTFEETMRIARAVCASGLAPAALIGRLTGDDAAAAVAVAIMSGAELGLKPMVSLRSFTVINGKPALYGDGLINVVRMSGKVAYLRTGCEERGGKMIGFCEAKRLDTGEDKRVEFSQADAERAGLWQTKAVVTKWNKWDKKNEEKPNDSPWYRFPQRMLAWRAAGYCLRELFGDVLGGIRDEFEAREIAETEAMRDITPAAESSESKPTPPKPPKPPAPPSKMIEAEAASEEQANEEPASDFALGDFLDEIETSLAGAKDEADVEEIWNDFDAPAVLESEGHADMIDTAFQIKTRRLATLSPLNGADHDQEGTRTPSVLPRQGRRPPFRRNGNGPRDDPRVPGWPADPVRPSYGSRSQPPPFLLQVPSGSCKGDGMRPAPEGAASDGEASYRLY